MKLFELFPNPFTASFGAGLLAQLPTLPAGSLETWILCALALLPALALLRNGLGRKTRDKAGALEHDTLQELERLRDRMDARFLALSDKLEQLKTELLAADERRAEAVCERLSTLEAGFARVDERTRD